MTNMAPTNTTPLRVPPLLALRACRASLRTFVAAIGTTFFVADARLGAILIVGLTATEPRSAAFALLGAIWCTLLGRALKPNKQLTLSGAFSLNGFFAGLAVATLFTGIGALIAFAPTVMLAAVFVVLLPRLLTAWQLPGLVTPYVFATWLVWTARHGAAALTAVPFVPPAVATDPWLALAQGTASGLAQIFFQSDWRLGAYAAVALLVVRWRTGAILVAGSLLGALVAALVGAPLANVAAGHYGFAPALAALGAVACLTSPSQPPKQRTLVVIITALGAAWLTIALAGPLYVLGLPALALPYMIALWAGLLLRPVVAATAWGDAGSAIPTPSWK